jgi:hypothetical protein
MGNAMDQTFHLEGRDIEKVIWKPQRGRVIIVFTDGSEFELIGQVNGAGNIEIVKL